MTTDGINLSLLAVDVFGLTRRKRLFVLLSVNVELEVLVVDFLVLAVGTQRQNGGVEFLFQILVSLAHRNTGTLTKPLGIGQFRADEFEGITPSFFNRPSVMAAESAST